VPGLYRLRYVRGFLLRRCGHRR